MLNWDDYRLILSIARAGTLRGAADIMGVTHTTISRRLAALSGKTDVDVFSRKAGGYRPTVQGEQFVQIAERMEMLAFEGDRYQSASSDALAGDISFSLPEPVMQYLLLDEIHAFCRQYPNIKLRVSATSSFVSLDRSEADVVLRGTNTSPPDHLVGRRLFPNTVSYFCRKDYIEQTAPEDLRWIAPLHDGLWPDWIENSPYPNAPIIVSIDDITARHMALQAGQGLGRGACFMCDPDPNLMRLPGSEPLPQHDFWVLTHPDLKDTPRVKLLMRFIVDAMNRKRALISGTSI